MTPPLRTPLLLAALFLAAAFFAGCSQQADGQDAAATAADTTDADRAARIAANLKHELPQLRGTDLEIASIAPSDVEGLDRGTFTVQGRTFPFLVTEDDTRLFLLAADPIDVSRTPDELAAAEAEEEAAAQEEAEARAARLAEAVEGVPMRGNPDAPVTIVEFSDFQCPYCERAAGTMETLLEARGDEVRLAYLHFPLPNHPWAKPAAIAAECAAKQSADAFWALHDGYFANQSQITTANVIEKSRSFLEGTGVDMDEWAACADDPSSEAYRAAAEEVQEMMALGQELGVTGTPAFFVDGTFASGALPLERFNALIEEAQADPSEQE